MNGAPGPLAPPVLRVLLLASSLVLALLLVGAAPAAAQSPLPGMVDDCAADFPEFRTACEDAALALQALQGGVGLLTTAGGALPASPSTAGVRLAGSPRIILDGGVSTARFRFPEPGRFDPENRDENRTLVGGRLVGTVGIFEGFSPVPTVGGVLGLDGVLLLRYHRLPSRPEDTGYDENVWAWGGGVRIGMIRESFSLPGVTITALHQRVGEVTYLGWVTEPGEPERRIAARTNPRVTSVRAEVGKDMLALGLTAGVAWDRYSGGASIVAAQAAPEFGVGIPFTGTGETSSFTTDRTYWFAGVNFTWVVVQAAAEVGWAGRPSRQVEFDGSGPVRTGGGSLQGALTLRITY